MGLPKFLELKKSRSDGPTRNRLCRYSTTPVIAWAHLPLHLIFMFWAQSDRASQFLWDGFPEQSSLKTNGKIYDWLPAAVPRV